MGFSVGLAPALARIEGFAAVAPAPLARTEDLRESRRPWRVVGKMVTQHPGYACRATLDHQKLKKLVSASETFLDICHFFSYILAESRSRQGRIPDAI
jgi:hypothetical protein